MPPTISAIKNNIPRSQLMFPVSRRLNKTAGFKTPPEVDPQTKRATIIPDEKLKAILWI